MIFASTDKNKEVLEKYKKLWNETKNQIETINSGEPTEYKKAFRKIKLKSDNQLLLGKILNIPSMIIVTRSVFQEDNKYYPRVYLHECLYKFVECLYECYNMKKLMFQKELTLINQTRQKNV